MPSKREILPCGTLGAASTWPLSNIFLKSHSYEVSTSVLRRVFTLLPDQSHRERGESVNRSVNSLSRDCVVEGVETEDQLNMLTEMGCNLIQGYIYSRPLKAIDVQPFLDQQVRTDVVAVG